MISDSLDLFFPHFLLAYGAIMSLILNVPFFVALADQQLPPTITLQIRSHRMLAFVALVVGAFWSLQNLWL